MNQQDFINSLAANNLSHHQPQFENLMRDTIRYSLHRIEDYAEHTLGQSMMGGLPEMPAGMDWPVDNTGTPLAFIAQLNLAEVKPFDTYDLLPATGFLYFFFEADKMMGGYDIKERDLFKVIYVDCGPEELVITKDYPEGLPELGEFWPCNILVKREISMPYKWGKDFSFLDSEERDRYGTHVWKGGYSNKSLGHADNLQGNMEPLCEQVMGGSDWVLLLQVDSNEADAYMMWADAGRLYFWIRREDLLKRDFSNCWCVLQDM